MNPIRQLAHNAQFQCVDLPVKVLFGGWGGGGGCTGFGGVCFWHRKKP